MNIINAAANALRGPAYRSGRLGPANGEERNSKARAPKHHGFFATNSGCRSPWATTSAFILGDAHRWLELWRHLDRPPIPCELRQGGRDALAAEPVLPGHVQAFCAPRRPRSGEWRHSPVPRRRCGSRVLVRRVVGRSVVRRMRSRGGATTTRSASWPIRMTSGDPSPARA